jgi:hypothetical protein
VTTEGPGGDRPRGLVLVVGPDGAGKTTLLDEVERQLGAPLARAHSRPGVIAGRGDGDGAPVTDPHGQRPRGVLTSLVKLLVVWLDTVVGTRRRWRPMAADRLLVVERGWFDLAVDPHRYRLPRSFSRLVAILGRTVPRADVAVLLTGDPAAFHDRKPEIGAAEVHRQLAAWERYAPRAGARVVRIDTVRQPVGAAAAQLLGELGATPRWYRVPLAPRRLDLRATGPGPALDIYRAHRPVARLVTRANPVLLRARLTGPADRPAVPGLDELLAGCARPVEQLVAFRSSAAGRWIVGAADRQRLHTIVKAGPASEALAREVRALDRLRSTDRILVPDLRGEVRVDGWHAAAIGALPGSGPAALQQVTAVATAFVRGDLGTPVVHGDLAPWNLAVHGRRLSVWDWESAELDEVRPLFDLAHYLIRSGTLLRRPRPTTVAAWLTRPGGPGEQHLAALGLTLDVAPTLVRRYLASTVPAEPREAVFRNAVRAALPR